ncbi:signal peptidase I [Entomospira entomophila]|uniref:Signal peptidase I n=1 Tax=Entomospira entomophila TaxID=2719988 RepID=A0A968GA31_9SPIO|nr:signal peptidase I [Entomospira entomophilus]NIZ40806.1 signal peptidase I [Entomospira entomophilus]WDI35018.1 signal peptidase I [Entomospira entomophilus]
MNEKQDQLGDFLVRVTENFLTIRKRHKLLVREKARRRGCLLDFVLSIPSTLLIVFFLNLYLIQAYVIPSSSMEDTLLVHDRILVDKLSYGPELWLGTNIYLPAIKEVKRGQIITFPNPEYEQQGVFFETARRVLFLLSFTLIDIAKENGQPPIDLLIKRAVGFDGDRVIFRDGDIFIKAEGESDFLPEPHFKFIHNLNYQQKRRYSTQDRELVARLEEYRTFRVMGLSIPPHLADLQEMTQARLQWERRMDQANGYSRARARLMISANKQKYLDDYYFHSRGIYVPQGYALPLGDNRDNSHDGRYFGVIKQQVVQGTAVWRFWPVGRIGSVE